MSAVPAAHFLADFGADGDTTPVQPGAGADKVSGADAKVEESYSRGLLNGRAMAQAQFNTRLAEERAKYAAQLKAEREKWAAETGEALANRLGEAMANFETRVADAAARILKPFLKVELHRQAIAELQASLNVLVSADPGVSVHITAPEDVLEVLRVQLSERALTATYVPGDGCDVKIVAGTATLETCLKGWMDKLEEATR